MYIALASDGGLCHRERQRKDVNNTVLEEKKRTIQIKVEVRSQILSFRLSSFVLQAISKNFL